MRTTLDLDEDVIAAARQLAAQGGMSIGQVVSDLARRGLAPKRSYKMRNVVPVFAAPPGERKSGDRPDLELVNKLRDS